LRPARITAALTLIAGILVAASPGAVSACSSDHPTFAEAVRGARAIARVTVVEGFDTYTDDPTLSETYRVEQVLKGSLPEVVTVAPARTSLCGDTVSYFAGGEHAEGVAIVVAIDLPYYDQVIHPMWTEVDGQGVFGTAGVPSGVTSLAELESAVLAQVGLPDTSTDSSQPRTAIALALLGAIGVLFVARARRERRVRFG
jgi:hypothetical protein